MTLSSTTSAALLAWTGHDLAPQAQARIAAELDRLALGLQGLTPLPFDIQAHDFPKLLLELADDI